MIKQVRAGREYIDAVSQGHYDVYQGGLSGKYDNVRIYWEDQVRGIMLRPYLQALVNRKKKQGSKLRIVDLGAGTGEGFRLLTSWMSEEADLRLNRAKILPYDMIDAYVGCDLSETMVDQGNINYADRPNVTFRQGDISKGFPLKDEKPFDLYFCSYGSFSHINGMAMEHLLKEIVGHASGRAIVVGEWLGRHSLEWPCYWDEPGDRMLDYSMSWLPTETEPEDGPEYFPIRFWLGDEIRALVNRVAKKTKIKINILGLHDCSIFVGRHIDTGEYNKWICPIRLAVNHLHEPNVRTDLESLKIDMTSAPGHDELNRYFTALQFSWNNLVNYCQKRLEKQHHPVRTKHWRSFLPGLQMAMMTLDRVIDTAFWIRMGDPRANIIEPQLGYALRNLELEFQQGAGRGHSLVGIFEIYRR